MCGIAGYVGMNVPDARSVLDALKHRGPDGEGVFSSQVQEGLSVTLYHRRLSIVDLSDRGHQPMSFGQFTLVFNGEIYNYKDLRNKYLVGENLNSATDTEVLLRIWAKLGPACLHELNGDFAFAIYNKQKEKLYLVRDRMGVKPLYYATKDKQIFFGSEIHALGAMGMPLELNMDALPLYLAFKYSPGSKTRYKRIKRITPGTYRSFNLRNGKSEEVRWYATPHSAPPQSKIAAMEMLQHTMQDAVALRAEADVPVCNFFSGGLDSSIIAWHLRDHPEIWHYCAAKEQRDLKKEGTTSDIAHARKLAQLWNLHLTEVPIAENELNDQLLREVFRHNDDLIADGSQVPAYLIAQEAGKHARVALSGMGADELFLGYGGHKLLVLSHYLDVLPDYLAKSFTGLFADLEPGKGYFKAGKRWLKKMGQSYQSPWRAAAYSVVGDLEAAKRICTGNTDVIADFLSTYFQKEKPDFNALMRFERENFLVKNLHYIDRMCMAHGVEARVPFLDHRVVALAASIPLSWKIDSLGRGKQILIQAYQNNLPAHIYKRRKAGFGMPLRSLLSRKEVLDKLLPIEELTADFPLDGGEINKLIQAHQNGHEDQSALLWALISLHYSKLTIASGEYA